MLFYDGFMDAVQMTTEQIFTAEPKTEWAPKTPWGKAITARIGVFDAVLQADGKIEIRTVVEDFSSSPKKVATLFENSGKWGLASNRKMACAAGEDAHWTAGVATFDSLGAAVSYLAAVTC